MTTEPIRNHYLDLKLIIDPAHLRAHIHADRIERRLGERISRSATREDRPTPSRCSHTYALLFAQGMHGSAADSAVSAAW